VGKSIKQIGPLWARNRLIPCGPSGVNYRFLRASKTLPYVIPEGLESKVDDWSVRKWESCR